MNIYPLTTIGLNLEKIGDRNRPHTLNQPGPNCCRYLGNDAPYRP